MTLGTFVTCCPWTLYAGLRMQDVSLCTALSETCSSKLWFFALILRFISISCRILKISFAARLWVRVFCSWQHFKATKRRECRRRNLNWDIRIVKPRRGFAPLGTIACVRAQHQVWLWDWPNVFMVACSLHVSKVSELHGALRRELVSRGLRGLAAPRHWSWAARPLWLGWPGKKRGEKNTRKMPNTVLNARVCLYMYWSNCCDKCAFYHPCLDEPSVVIFRRCAPFSTSFFFFFNHSARVIDKREEKHV